MRLCHISCHIDNVNLIGIYLFIPKYFANKPLLDNNIITHNGIAIRSTSICLAVNSCLKSKWSIIIVWKVNFNHRLLSGFDKFIDILDTLGCITLY